MAIHPPRNTVRPGKIVCVGRNYRDHAKELGNDVPAEPLIFLKPPSSVISDGESIVLPHVSKQVEFEGEIGIVIGRTLRAADERTAADGIRGLVAVNDVTARDLQKTDGQWTRAKGFDTFCAVSSEVAMPRDQGAIEVVTRVNGVEKQRGRATEMVFPIPRILSWISHVMTLEVGDLVATGTPAGVGRLSPGDMVEIELREIPSEGKGRLLVSLANPVVASSAPIPAVDSSTPNAAVR
jgi:2-keto-4-pentenoate hydratase/2-oxohepta-3-ene-1,7-dioic acid hydratase in catechol pathway